MPKVKIVPKNKYKVLKAALKSARAINPAEPPIPSSIIQPPSIPQVQEPKPKPFKTMSKKISKLPRDFEIPRKPFARLLRDIALVYLESPKFTKDALEALQFAAEDYVVNFIQDANLACKHRKSQTLMHKDMILISNLRRIDIKLY